MAKSQAKEQKKYITPRQFRLSDDTLADLDFIAAFHSKETGSPHNRTDAVRVAVKREADRIRRKDGAS
jgi:hypothetical protein